MISPTSSANVSRILTASPGSRASEAGVLNRRQCRPVWRPATVLLSRAWNYPIAGLSVHSPAIHGQNIHELLMCPDLLKEFRTTCSVFDGIVRFRSSSLVGEAIASPHCIPTVANDFTKKYSSCHR